MMDPLVRLAAAADIALNIAHETGHSLISVQSGLAQFGLLMGGAYLLHEACGGAATIVSTMHIWWRRKRR